MTNCTAFYAKKGGVGVTTVAMATAILLAEGGNRVLFCDGDNYCACGMTVAGLEGKPTYDATDYERGRCRAKQLLVEHPRQRNLYLLPTLGATKDDTAENAVGELCGIFDYVICDGVCLPLCDRVLVVTEPYPCALRNAEVTLCALRDEGKKTGVVINRVVAKHVKTGEVLPPKELALTLHAPLWGVLPEDENLPLGKWNNETRKAFVALCDKMQEKKPPFRLQRRAQDRTKLLEGELL